MRYAADFTIRIETDPEPITKKLYIDGDDREAVTEYAGRLGDLMARRAICKRGQDPDALGYDTEIIITPAPGKGARLCGTK